MMLTLWSLASNHCKLETFPGLSFLECSSETATETHCDDNECKTVESGFYKKEDNQKLLATVIAADLTEVILVSAKPEIETASIHPAAAPPELPQRWQFVFRTASTPRAPSFAS